MRKKSPIPPNGEILLYQAPDGTAKLNVRLVNESVWLSIDQMALLFGVDKSGISRHLKNIFATGELVKSATVAKFATVQTEGTRTVERNIDCYSSGHISHKQAIEKLAFLSCILNVYFNFQNIGHTSLQSLRIFLYLKHQYR